MEEGEGEGGEGHQDPLFPSWKKKLSPFMWGVWATLCSPHPTPGSSKVKLERVWRRDSSGLFWKSPVDSSFLSSLTNWSDVGPPRRMREPYKLESQRPGCLFAGARIGDAPEVQAELSLPVSSPSPPTCQGLREPWVPWDCPKDSPHPTNSLGLQHCSQDPLYPSLDTLMRPQQRTLGTHWDSAQGQLMGWGSWAPPDQPSACFLI